MPSTMHPVYAFGSTLLSYVVAVLATAISIDKLFPLESEVL